MFGQIKRKLRFNARDAKYAHDSFAVVRVAESSCECVTTRQKIFNESQRPYCCYLIEFMDSLRIICADIIAYLSYLQMNVSFFSCRGQIDVIDSRGPSDCGFE